MDELLDVLLDAALSAETAAGEDRIAALATRLGEEAPADSSPDLAALETAAVERFNGLYGDGTSYDPADAPTLEALADVVDAIRQVRAARTTEAREGMTDRVSALAGRVRASNTPDGPGSTEGGAGTAGPPADAPAPPPAEPGTPPAPAQVTTAAEVSAPPAPAPAPTQRPNTAAAVVAAGGGAAPTASQGRTPGTPTPHRHLSITASAEVPNTPYGADLTLDQLAEAAAARYGTFPSGQPTSGPLKANVALIRRRHTRFQLSGDQSDAAMIDEVADERRLPGGSLVAAATRALTAAVAAPGVINDVWCTPSETDYTLCPSLATEEGMLDLPTTGLPARGGVRYPVWTQYPEQAADAARNGWHGDVVQYPAVPADPGTGLDNPTYFQRDAADVPPGTGLGNTKRSIEGPCVTWKEARASVAYLNIISDLLRDKTFPEGNRRFTEDVLVHHAHYLNELKIAYIQAAADPIPAFSVFDGAGSIGSTSTTAVDRVSLLVAWMRQAYQMTRRATLELVAPDWLSEYLKRDIEKKQNRPHGTVSDAEIATLFAQYASRVQWVRDWQPMANGAAVGGRVMPPDAWPAAVNLLAYPAGSWVYSEGNVLTLGVQYDYQLLQENKYSSMFTEDSWLLLNRCNRTFMVQLTELCANGAVGPARDACPPVVVTGLARPDSVDTEPQDTEPQSTEPAPAAPAAPGTDTRNSTSRRRS